MQLDTARPTALRERLSRAALALLLVPTGAAGAAATATEPPNQIDFTTLYYGEQGRVQVYEPILRATRLLAGDQSLSCQATADVITGASPSGALPSGTVQTHTSASGRVTTVAAGAVPVTQFQDLRVGLDGSWQKTFGRRFTSTLGAHASREKDYQSLGVDGKLSVELMSRLLTITAGGGINDDSVFPTGGTPLGLSDGTVLASGDNTKRVSNLLLGVSRILSRRWMVALDGSRTYESGYLTEPYKVISLMDPVSGIPVGQLTDNRPSSRTRSSLLLSSVYHLSDDVVYASWRAYRDSWGVASNTLDLEYRHDFEGGDGSYIAPHLRLYRQTAADFHTIGLVSGAPLPEFASSDYRLGQLTTLTAGLTFAFRFDDTQGLWTVRTEFIRQAGDGSPPNAIGVQRGFDLAPSVNTITAVIGYSFNF